MALHLADPPLVVLVRHADGLVAADVDDRCGRDRGELGDRVPPEGERSLARRVVRVGAEAVDLGLALATHDRDTAEGSDRCIGVGRALEFGNDLDESVGGVLDQTLEVLLRVEARDTGRAVASRAVQCRVALDLQAPGLGVAQVQVEPVALERRQLVDHGPDLGDGQEVAGRIELQPSMRIARVVEDRDRLCRPGSYAGDLGVDCCGQQLPQALEAVEQAVCLRRDDLGARTRDAQLVALVCVGRWETGHRPQGQCDVILRCGTCRDRDDEPGGGSQIAGEDLSRGGERAAGNDDPGLARELPRRTGAGRLLHRHGNDLTHDRRRLGAGPELELVERVADGGGRSQALHPDTGDRVLPIDDLGILVGRIHHVRDRRPGLAVGVRRDLQFVLRRLGRRGPAAEHLVDRSRRRQLDLEPVLGRVVPVAVVRGPAVVHEHVGRVGRRVRRGRRRRPLRLRGRDRARQQGEVDTLGGLSGRLRCARGSLSHTQRNQNGHHKPTNSQGGDSHVTPYRCRAVSHSPDEPASTIFAPHPQLVQYQPRSCSTANYGGAGAVREELGEVGGVVEAEALGDLDDRYGFVDQQAFGFEDDATVDELLGRGPCVGPGEPVQGALGVAETPGIAGNAAFPVKRPLDLLLEPAEDLVPGTQRTTARRAAPCQHEKCRQYCVRERLISRFRVEGDRASQP